MRTIRRTAQEGEEGFVLVGLIVAIFLILLVLGVAAPRVAKALRREREVEAVHRGNQYVRAVQLYYRKNGHYPGSMEQLEKTNNIRYLRQKYVDPMTGKPDWKLIHVGEAKTTVKGFFGKPLSGLATGGLGSAAGMASTNGPVAMGAAGAGSSGTSSFGSSSFGSPGASSGSGSSFGSSSFGSSTPSTGSSTMPGTGATTDPGSSTSSTTGSTGVSSQSATSFTGTGAPIMGVGTVATGNSIVVLNEQTTYPKWEFIYDPRIEQLKAKANLLGGGPPSTNATSLGSSGTSSGLGGMIPPGAGGINPSGFGAGSSGSSGFGSGTTTPAPTTPTTPTQ